MRGMDEDIASVTPGRTAGAMARSSEELRLTFSDVVMLLASNEKFIPYVSVALQSALEHTCASRHYDIVILGSNLKPESMEMLSAQVAVAGENCAIDFLDVASAMDGARLPRHGRFGAEASFRLLAPSLLTNVRKAIYLDSDLIVLHDLAELFDIELGDNLLGAVRDADTAGIYSGYDTCVRHHLDKVVGLADPFTYFQSGVLLINLAEFRRSCTLEDMLAYARPHKLRWPDQDVLNHVCQGRYLRIDSRWNVLTDWQRLRRSRIVAQAPKNIQDDYDAARKNPFILHYAGPDGRPWLYPTCDAGSVFWDYATRSPFYGELQRRLHVSHHSLPGLAKRLQVALIYKVGMPAFDAVFPPSTRRRHAVLTVYEKLGGSVT